MIKRDILGHIKDLRKILIRGIIVFSLTFFVAFYYSESVFQKLILLLNLHNMKLIFSSIEGGFISKVSISFNVTMILLLPYFALEILLYTRQAFEKNKSLVWFFIVASFFYFIGIVGTVKWIIPIFASFLLSMGIFGIEFYVDAGIFIEFLMKIIFAFAVIFEFPVVLMLLLKMKIITREFLKKQRKKVFVFSFILGALLTPPDVLSQVFAAGLFYSFYEGVILLSKFLRN